MTIPHLSFFFGIFHSGMNGYNINMKTKNNYCFFLILYLISIFFTGCVTQTPIVQEVIPEPQPTPVQCSAQTNNVNIHITSSDKLLVTITGLQPGENIVLIYERNLPESDWRRENGQTVFTPISTIGADGAFMDSRSFSRFEAEDGVTPNEWVVKVIHTSGVTCAYFIPPEQ